MWKVLSAALLFSVVLGAQSAKYGAGRAPSAEEIRALGPTVGPDGRGLPPGSGTAKQGREVFAARCARCHGDKALGDVGPALVGGKGSLATAKPVKTVGSFWPYATSVWDYVNRAMPFDKPGSLTHSEVYSAVAFLLHLNGIAGETEVMDAKSLARVRMPNRDGFVPDGRPDVKR
ncbi:MAG: c-type cytochrome [Acidobacteria bacterium]|nr:c-type cytochrome [Acidobacteriota bacterium]